MPEIAIEQALYRRVQNGTPVLLGHSSGFAASWFAEAEQLILGFGDRPRGVRCAGAVFAQPLGKEHVAVVQVADEASPTPEPLALCFRILTMPRPAYTELFGDPFAIAARFEPAWQARGELPSLSLPAEPLPRRTVAEVQKVLQRVKQAALLEDVDPPSGDELEDAALRGSEGPALLGGAQVLVDGGKVVFERPAADTGLLHGLWLLLPTTTRNQLWPASFAFGNQLGFDALIVPRIEGEHYVGYTLEEQAADYPTGRYELALQTAVEAGDQDELDALFSRRSVKDTWRLGLGLLAIVSLAVLALRFFGPPAPPEPPRPRPLTIEQRRELAGIAAGAISSSSAGNPWSTLGLIQVGNDKSQKMRQAP